MGVVVTEEPFQRQLRMYFAHVYFSMGRKNGKVKTQKRECHVTKVVFWFPNSEHFFPFPTPGVTSPPFLATVKDLSNSLLRGKKSLQSMKCQLISSPFAPGDIW